MERFERGTGCDEKRIVGFVRCDVMCWIRQGYSLADCYREVDMKVDGVDFTMLDLFLDLTLHSFTLHYIKSNHSNQR